MPANQRRRRTLLTVLLLVSLVLLTLDFRQGDEGPIGRLQHQAMTLFSPVQNVLARVVQPIGNFASGVRDLTRLRAENLRLADELRELRERQVSLADLERENADLRELVRMAERFDYATSGARIVAQPPGAFRWSLLIDIGWEQGVSEGMAVVNADGLVGKITDVSANYSRVQLAASPNARYSVRIAETAQQGLLSGRGARAMELRVLDDPDQLIPDGAEVVTRAFQGTSIPDGIPIGAVEEVESMLAERTQLVSVAPFVDWSRLDLVLVVLDAPAVPSDDELELPEDEEEIDDELDEGLEGSNAMVDPRRGPRMSTA